MSLLPKPGVTVRMKTPEELNAPYVPMYSDQLEVQGDRRVLDIRERWAAWEKSEDERRARNPEWSYDETPEIIDWCLVQDSGATHVRVPAGLYTYGKHGLKEKVSE
jgi:hypothetical protein